MTKNILQIFIRTNILLLLLFQTSFANEIDPTLKKIKLSGFLRIRQWNALSKTKIADKFDITDEYQYGSYQDIFVRNRIYLKALPNLEIRTVFDIFALSGKDNFAIESGSTNLITRDVYVVFNPTDNSEFSIGLKPFSLTGGYILGRDASGMDYNHTFFNKKLKIYFAFINAYDDANDSFGNNTEPADYSDDIITYGGLKAKFSDKLSSEFYYVFENDKYTSASDTHKSKLHWIGFHNTITFRRMFLKLGGIFNTGNIEIDNSGTFEKTDIMAGLLEFEISYKSDNYLLGLIFEGATGDPNDPDAGSSFQDIKSSYSFSYIIVDNSGGLALRGYGSSWYGLYGTGMKFSFSLIDLLIFDLKYVHYRTYKSVQWKGTSATWLGDEANLKVEYTYKNTLSIFLTGAAFLPNDAYNGLDNINYPVSGGIFEFMLGAKVVY